MQCPIKCCTNQSELRWSARLESVRKDVECFFGRLKARFCILHSHILFHHQNKVDNVFTASSILHNEFDVAWKDPLNWETPQDEDDTDIREARERLRMRGRLVHPDAIVQNTNEEIRNINVEDPDDFEDASYSEFRKQLIDHYIYCSDNNLIEWI